MIKNLVRLSLSVMLLLGGCSVAGSGVVTLTATLIPPPVATATPTPSPNNTPLPKPSATDPPLPTPSPTNKPTAMPILSVFDPAALGDNRELASFILTRKDTITGGEVIDHQDTIGYIKEPYSAYKVEKFTLGDVAGEAKTYRIGGRLYDKTSMGDWAYYVEADQGKLDTLRSATDMREFYVKGLIMNAQFVGQVDFQSIPANHFTINQTDLSADAETGPGGYKVEKTQGDLYLAQGGNYLLHFHVKLTGNVHPVTGSSDYSPGVHEITEDLSSINQLKDIAVPSDFLALKLELDLGLPLPAGTTLAGIVRYKDGISVDYYKYTTPVSNDEFLEFYKNLVPTNGWTVSYIGQVAAHYICDTQACVILKKENVQIILYHDQQQDATGTNYNIIGADYDKLHIYHPK